MGFLDRLLPFNRSHLTLLGNSKVYIFLMIKLVMEMTEKGVWNYYLDRMVIDSVRRYFQLELAHRRMFSLTEFSVDLSKKYKGLDVPLGRRFSIDIVGLDADLFRSARPEVGVLIEIESPSNSAFQIENNRRKLCLLSKDFECAALQIFVPSLICKSKTSETLWKKIEGIVMEGKPLDDYIERLVRGASLFFLNPFVRLEARFAYYPKGFRKFAIPMEKLSWWMEMLLGYSLGNLAGRMRCSSLFNNIEKMWNIDDAYFLAELERRENDFPVFAQKLHSFCMESGIMEISAFAGFAHFKGNALTSDHEKGGIWYRMEDERLLKIVVAGVRLGLFEGPVDATDAGVAKSGLWKVVLPSSGKANGQNPQAGEIGGAHA
jgi:hypothetical protein